MPTYATSGRCLCGQITFQLTSAPTEMGACHCGMCRKWSGGIYIATTVAPDGITFSGAEHLKTYASSPWAERGFCPDCGSSLFYRVTAEGPHEGTYHLAVGALDDPGDATLTGELFIDLKPQGYSFAQDTHQMTAAEVEAMFNEI